MHLSTRGATARLTLIGVVLALGACSAAATPVPTAAPTAAPATAAPSVASVGSGDREPQPEPDRARLLALRAQDDHAREARRSARTTRRTARGGPARHRPPGRPWQYADPNNGQGLEGATAYLIAKALGFAKTDVTWVDVHFDAAIQPGPKKFDLYLAQVSYSAERAQRGRPVGRLLRRQPGGRRLSRRTRSARSRPSPA